jgi:hypothetical protein
LRASLAASQQQTGILKSNYDQATANVAGLAAQVAFNAKRARPRLFGSGTFRGAVTHLLSKRRRPALRFDGDAREA